MRSKWTNLFIPLLLSGIIIALLMGYLYSNIDIGLHRTFETTEFISSLALLISLFGSWLTFRVLKISQDHRDVDYMPFVYVTNADAGGPLNVRFKNVGKGPALNITFSSKPPTQISDFPQPLVLPAESTQMHSKGLPSMAEFKEFMLYMHCNDQVGNSYKFNYHIKEGVITFLNTEKNGERMI